MIFWVDTRQKMYIFGFIIWPILVYLGEKLYWKDSLAKMMFRSTYLNAA